ncbi:MAG: acetyltransferase [Eggerthellaceae bacterium]|nr:acetyltransferase [Eggerthellaceae bacterium]
MATRTRYIPALDGLRSFAVLAVIFYHMGFSWAIGGLLGVTMFFVLSGYLITSLLIVEYRKTGSIDLPNFWLRRVRRLVPAIITVIIVVALLCTIFNHVLLTKMRPDVIPSLFFFSNWWQIFHNVSYFDAIGSPSPLQHFWSLAIEEQFYLIWPPLLLLLFRSGIDETPLRRGVLVLALISTVLMAFMYSPDADPSRVYYGTDTRAFSLLIGAWLAFVWPAGLLTEKSGGNMTASGRLIFDGVGAIALIGVLAMCAFISGYSPFLYRGGIFLCSILTAIVIAVIAHPVSMLGRLMSLPPLVWIGKRSYGMYLWHYPILLLMTDPNATTAPHPLWLVLELALIIGVSALSYTFIENPIRHGAIGNWLADVRDGYVYVSDFVRMNIVPIAGCALATLIAIGGLLFVPDEAGLKNMEALEQASIEAQQQLEEARLAEEAEGVYDVLLIGDSVSVRTIPFFQESFPTGLIDSAISRQMAEAIDIFKQYEKQGAIGNKTICVFALGTNGPITEDILNELIATAGNRQIYFVTNRAPLGYIDSNNALFTEAADKYPNVSTIDWNALSAGHDEWFDGDGTHLTEESAKEYTKMVLDATGYVAPSDATGVGDTAEDIYGIAIGDEENVLSQQLDVDATVYDVRNIIDQALKPAPAA